MKKEKRNILLSKEAIKWAEINLACHKESMASLAFF